MEKNDLLKNKLLIAAESMIKNGLTPSVDKLYQQFNKKITKKIITSFLTEWRDFNSHKIQDNIISSLDTLKNEEKATLLAQKRTQELKQSLALTRATLESTADGILIVGKTGKMIDWNRKFVDILKVDENVLKSRDERAGLRLLLDQVSDPEALYNVVMQLNQTPDKGDAGDCYFKDGRILERYSQPLLIDDEIIGRVWSFRDVTKQRQAQESLLLQDRAIQASPNGIVITDNSKEKRIIYVNPAFEKITGYMKHEVLGKSWDFLRKSNENEKEIKALDLAIKEQKEINVLLRNYRKDGSLFWNQMQIAPVFSSEGSVSHYVSIMTDFTHQKAMEDQLLYQATYDSLTRLPNRSLLSDRINQALINCKRTKTFLAVAFLDLDHFKLVNDSFGHNVGDKLLKIIAERLTNCLRESDTAARLGGDEFVIIMPFLKTPSSVLPAIRKILDSIQPKVLLDGIELNISASIGVSFYPKDARNVDDLLKNSDIAMYKAKDEGRNTFQFYTQELQSLIVDRLHTETNLRNAIINNELSMQYQALYNIKTHCFCECEALARWHHPKLGDIPPSKFIPVAEESGLIIDIGHWILQKVCRQTKIWHNKGLSIKTSVNISAQQFKQDNFVNDVKEIILLEKLTPNDIELELTESMLIEDFDENLKKMHALKKIGFSLALDDFGTGYSSLSYLKAFPIDRLKIDRSFIMNITTNKLDIKIVQAIINLAKSLNLNVIAEGVETEAQEKILHDIGCDTAQGFLFHRPSNIKDFEALCKNCTKKSK